MPVTRLIYSWASVSCKDWLDWKWQYNNRLQTIDRLAGYFNLSPEKLHEWKAVARYYRFSITPYYFSLMDATDDNDPIRLQCLPDQKETDFSSGSATDPLDEGRDMRVPGLVHRYPDRCVAIITNICATYCRHCNRKQLWKVDAREYNRGYLRAMIDYVSQSPHVREVIVSGGDPLTMKESTLEWFLRSLRSIPHVEILRIGSRIPVVMPMRITRQLCSMLHKYRPLWFNTQFNHPREITPEAGRACEMLMEEGIPVSNQSVFLRGVNDNYETMRTLLYGLQRISVRPYYLFHCDPVKGADHFRTDVLSGICIMEKLWKNISGLCIPQYVYDVPGGKGKFPVHPFSLFPAERLESDEHYFDKRDKVN